MACASWDSVDTFGVSHRLDSIHSRCVRFNSFWQDTEAISFVAESPRWLLSRDRAVEAKANLDRLRRSSDINSGITEAEINAMEMSLEENRLVDQVSWSALFKGNHLRRCFVSDLIPPWNRVKVAK